MAERGARTLNDVKVLIGELRDVLSLIGQDVPIKAGGKSSFAELGITLVYGNMAAACDGGCTGCGGCEGCAGCSHTLSSGGMSIGDEVINPAPFRSVGASGTGS